MRLLLIIGIILTHISTTKPVEFCDNFKIVSVLDIPPAPLTPGGNYFLLTLTVKEDTPSGTSNYANIYFEDNFGDTVSVPTGPSSTLPVLKSDTIPYILLLNTEKSNQDFPEDYKGKLIIEDINKPRCEIQYSNIIASINEEKTDELIYPNSEKKTLIFDINGKLLITSINSATPDYSHLENGFYILIIYYENGNIESEKLVIN